jgi:outer membrane protein TolC
MRGARKLATALLLVAAVAAPAAAVEPSPPPRSPGLSGQPISLDAAVAATLRHSYEVQREAAKVAERRGVWQEAEGIFDPTLFLDSEVSQLQQDLIRAEITNEIRRRVPAEFAAIARPEGPPGALDFAAGIIEAGTPAAADIVLAECSRFDTQFIVDAGAQGSVTLCLGDDLNLHGIVIDGAGATGEDLDRLIATLQVLEQLGSQFQAEIQNQIRQLLRDTASLLRQFAEALRQQRARLGGLPSEAQLLDLRFELGNRFLLRNGTLITVTLDLVGTEDNFAGKRHDPAFGGQVSPDTFTTTAALRFNVPLGRGRGRLATAGPVEAAKVAMQAEQRLLLFTASSEALGTVRAYWALAAAQARLGLLERSVAANERILDQTRTLIDAGELPGVERGRAEAKLADARRRVAEQRRALVDARLDLVTVMGQSVDTSEQAPLAADPLPGSAAIAAEAAPAPGTAAGWFDRAQEQRFDLAALSGATRATTILRDVARANLRRPVDFVLRIAYSGFDESFTDRIWDLGAYGEAAGGRIVGPSYAIGLRVAWPIANRSARGALLQAESTLAQSQIDEADVARQIKLRLTDLASKRTRRLAEAAALRDTLQSLERTLESATERFRLGDITLIDALTTESQLTDARLALLDVERELASLEADIRFESGALLTAPSSVDEADPTTLQLVPFSAAGGPGAGARAGG